MGLEGTLPTPRRSNSLRAPVRRLPVAVDQLFREAPLLALAAGHTHIAKLLNFRFQQEALWRQLFYELHQLLDLVWNLVSGVQPTISPNELYARLCSVQEQWMSYRASHCEESIGAVINDEGQSHTHMKDETELFERLMGHVKELMAITPA